MSIALFALLLGVGAPLRAQITAQTGAVRVTVTDAKGGTISGAKVTLDSATAPPAVKETVEDGTVVFPLVAPGTYKVTVEAASFKRTVLAGVNVSVTDVTNLRATMELGAVSTEIVVSAVGAETVNTTNATLGDVLSGDVLRNLPLSTQNFTFLLALNAGTSASLADATGAGRGTAIVFVNGQRGTANNLVIDGVDSNNLGNNNFGAVPIPAPNALEELRVQTSLYDASQGKTSGGNIDVITRGGTNQYHGLAYDYFRNNDLDANSFFFNQNGTPRPILKQNQFGGDFGGPVLKLHDTFFFFSYQGTRQANGASSGINTQFPILPATRDAASLATAFSTPTAPLLASQIDPTAVRLLNLPGIYGGFLVPSGRGTPGNGAFGPISFSQPLHFTENQFVANGDRNIGSKHKISEKFFFSNDATVDPFGGEGAGSFGSGDSTPFQNRLASLSWTYAINSNLINEARFGYNRITAATVSHDPATESQLGQTRFNSAQFPGIPLFITGDINPAFGGISTNFDQASVANTFNFADTLAYTRGKHSFRFGFEYRRYQINLFNNFASRGFLFFNTFTDLLQGNILESFVGTGITDRGFRARDAAGYFQDDWKITRRLTVNLGVRYDYLGPSTDVKDRLGNFDPSRLDATTLANGGPGLLNGFILPAGANFGSIKGTPGVSDSTLTTSSPHDFAPRIGLAWDVKGDGKTAVRAGYGIYYVRVSNQTLLQLITGAPFFQLSANVFPGTPLSNPFPNLPVSSQFPIFPTPPQLTGFRASGAPTFNAPTLSLNPFQRDLGIPYVESWNVSVQRELPKHFVLEVAYFGSEGVKLLQSLQLNQAQLVNANNPRVLGGANGVPQTTITDNSSGNANARVGVLGFGSQGLNTVTGNGHSNYNALGVTLKWHGGNSSLQSAYTYSKSIDNNSGAATQDLANSLGNQLDTTTVRGLSGFDRTHREQVTYTYSIPAFSSGRLHQALGHWSVGGLSTFQSGLPNSFTCPICPLNLFGQPQSNTFPQVTGNLNNLFASGSPQNFTSQNANGTGAFNAGVFGPTATNQPGTVLPGLNSGGGPGNQSYAVGGATVGSGNALFGNAGRGLSQVRGPFQQNWDVFVTKNFPFAEKYSIQFRTDLFNIFNHPNFIIDNTAIGSPSFGVYDNTVGNPRIVQFSLKFQF